MRTALRSALKAVRGEKDKSEATKRLSEATVILDKAAASGLIHKRNADRNKSRLSLFIQKLG